MSKIHAITFDLFGTIFDWRGTIIEKGTELNPAADWDRIATEWARGYSHAAKAGGVRIPLSQTLREVGEGLNLPIPEKEREHFVNIWESLRPYDDIDFLNLLTDVQLFGLSNADVQMSWTLANRSRLLVDDMISSDEVGEYKPHPEVYRFAAKYIQESPSNILMVAAHLFDLKGAKNVGYQTAFIRRPGEDDGDPNVDYVDFVCDGLEDLVKKIQKIN